MLIISTPWEGKKPDFGDYSVKYVEYRLDYCPNPLQINFSTFNKNDILCYKSYIDEPLLLDKMLSSKAMVDVDVDLLNSKNLSISPKMIVSTHLDSYDEAKIREFLAKQGNPFAFKLIFPAESFDEILKTAEMIRESGKTNVIFNVTGKWSKFQRPLYKAFASYGAYGYWDIPTEESQPEWFILSDIIEHILDKDNRFCGIFGGDDVSETLSYLSYGVIIQVRRLKASFVPIPCNDVQEAIQVIHWLLPRYHSLAFAITSPFKSALARAFKSRMSVINTLVFNSHRSYDFFYDKDLNTFVHTSNSDVKALEDCIMASTIHLESSIMIYGTGDCADAFVRKIQRMGFKNLYLLGRNPEKTTQLREKYQLSNLVPNAVELLINASDLGKDPDDDLTWVPKYNYLIDLPYIQGNETLLEIQSKLNDSQFIGGKDFFSVQASHQLKVTLPVHDPEDIDPDELDLNDNIINKIGVHYD